jgi:hypothetical protein
VRELESGHGRAGTEMTEQNYIRMLRDQLAALRARHDSGAMPAATYDVIQQLEIDIAWLGHRAAMEMRRRRAF